VPTLKVDFQEGFTGRTVILRINGKEVYRAEPRTRTQIGLADSRSFELPAQKVTLDCDIPDAGVSKALVLDLNKNSFVGVSLENGGAVSFKVSNEPFGYL